jgi:prefoldin subunit 5
VPVFGWHRALQRLNHLINRLEITVTAVDDAVQQLNEATDEIARDLEALREEIQAGDTAAAEKLTPIIGRLQALGQDPANPVPPTPAA